MPSPPHDFEPLRARPSDAGARAARGVGALVVLAALLLIVCAMPFAFGWRSRAKALADPPPAFHINVNTADSAELQLLPSVGPSLAEKIIAARQVRPFESIADMRRVSGIAQIVAARIEPYIIFR